MEKQGVCLGIAPPFGLHLLTNEYDQNMTVG